MMMQAKYNPFPDLPFAGEWTFELVSVSEV